MARRVAIDTKSLVGLAASGLRPELRMYFANVEFATRLAVKVGKQATKLKEA